MIISRTPFRISFFGGGTDYPVWFKEHGGAVIGTTIDKYCFITCRYLPPFFTHKHRLAYSRIEMVNSTEEIEHPAVRACLQYMGIPHGLEIHHDGDLPARAGMGSSSAFTVGMLHALSALKGQMRGPMDLALEAIHVEQNVIGENVGAQDQAMAAFGGFNRIEFFPDGTIQPTPVILKKERLEDLQSHLMLVYTGVSRFASDIAKDVIANAAARTQQLHRMRTMVDEAVDMLNSSAPITDFGAMLDETWQLKRQLTSGIATSHVDEIYTAAREVGATGGKLLGAGGGGFFLFFAPPSMQPAIAKRLKGLLHVPFRFHNGGSQIIYYNSDGWTP